MWQNLLRHCTVFTETSEGFAPYYLAGIRHDMRQTTLSLWVAGRRKYICPLFPFFCIPLIVSEDIRTDNSRPEHPAGIFKRKMT